MSHGATSHLNEIWGAAWRANDMGFRLAITLVL